MALLCMGLGLYSQNTNNSTKNQKTMKEFILIVRLPEAYSTDDAVAVRPQWNALTDKWKAEGTFITSYVFPNPGYVVLDAQKNSKKEYVKTSGGLKEVSNIIVQAVDLEQALNLAKLCPVLEQGGTVEVREVQARPVVVEK